MDLSGLDEDQNVQCGEEFTLTNRYAWSGEFSTSAPCGRQVRVGSLGAWKVDSSPHAHCAFQSAHTN